MVGGFDHIQVVLNDHHGVARVHQLLEHLNEPVHIVAVKAGGGLVQDIDGLARGALAELRGQLHPLGLAAGQLGGGLAQLHIAQAHLLQGFQAVIDPGQVLKEGHGLVYGHFQHFIDVLALVAHLQGLPVVALALTHLAGDVDVRQEVHFDLQKAVAGTGFAPAAPGIEGEPSRAIAPALGVGGGGKQLPNVVEKPGVGGGVRPGGAADGALVDVDDLVQILLALDPVVLARPGLGAVQVGPQLFKEDLVDQGGLAAAGHAGDTGEGTQREGYVDVAQVVLRGAHHLQVLSVALPALLGYGDLPPPGKVVGGKGVFAGHDLLRGAAGHDLAPVDARSGADVHNIVRRAHGVLVVLHHQQGVAQVPQVLHGLQQHVVVPLVKADGGLVQDIEHSHEGGADLSGQTDTLALAAGQGPRLPAEGQVLKAHGAQEAQAVFDLLQNPLGNHGLGGIELQLVNKRQCFVHTLAAVGVDVQPAHGDGQGLLLQALALTGGTGALGHALLQLPLHGVGLGLPVAPLQIVDNALKGLVQGTLAPGLVVVEGELLPIGAVQNDVQHLFGQILDGGVQLEFILFGQGVKVHPGDAIGLDVVPARGSDGPLHNGQILVGDNHVRVNLHLGAQTHTGGAGAEGVIEGEHPGRQLLNGHAAVLTGVVLGEEDVPVLPHDVDDHQAAGQVGGHLHTVGEAAVDVLPDDQAVHHDLDIVFFVLLQLDLLAEIIGDAVHPAADIARLPGILKDLGVLALLPPDHRSHHLDAGSLGQGQDLVDNLVDGLLLDLLAADGTVGRAHPGPQQTEIVVNLRHGAHGGTGVFAGGLLVDGDGGRKAVNIIHIGLLHLAQEHPGIGGERLHIPPLALGIDGIEGQGGLARSGQAGEHHQFIPGNGHINIFQVVHPGAFYINVTVHWAFSFSDGQIRGGRSHQGNEVSGSQLHLVADLPCGNGDGVDDLRRLMKDGGVLLFHAHRGTAPVDIAGEGEQLLLVEHGNGLLPHCLCRLLQVQTVPHGDVKNIEGIGGPPGHQSFEHALRVLAQRPGHSHAVHGHALLMGVGVGGVGDPLLFQNAHHIGFFVFLLGHRFTCLLTQ